MNLLEALDWVGRVVVTAKRRLAGDTDGGDAGLVAAAAAVGAGGVALLRGRTQNFLDDDLRGVTNVAALLRSRRVVAGSIPLPLALAQPE